MRAVVTPLTRIIEIINARRTASILLDTYVGNRAGERILGGQIRRGHTETMHAAIWLSDLRGFTALSDRLPAETVVDILNHYFDCQVAAIRAHGGEVLKFMGDGLLAVFPIDEYVGDIHQVCSSVLEAARESRASVDALQLSDRRRPSSISASASRCMSGQILYGNIGGGNRLDFTCIGPAVNLAARLEKMAGKLASHDRGVGGICRVLPAAAGPISASFRSRGFRRPSASMGCRTKRQASRPPRRRITRWAIEPGHGLWPPA